MREGSFGFLVQSIARRLDSRMKSALLEVSVDVKVFANLMVLSEQDGINQRTIGERLNFPEYFTSRNVDLLVKAGLAERRSDPDSRRAFLIFLTSEGRSKAALLPAIIQRVNDEVLADLPPSDRTKIVDLLKLVARVLWPPRMNLPPDNANRSRSLLSRGEGFLTHRGF